MSIGLVLAILVSGFVTGGLARLALPGPDPMPIWLTIAIGLTGSIVGAVIADVISNDNGYLVSFLSFGIAVALVASYRKFVQKRPVWGAAARVEQVDRLRGIERIRLEAMLRELHRAGVLDDDELAAKLAQLGEHRSN